MLALSVAAAAGSRGAAGDTCLTLRVR